MKLYSFKIQGFRRISEAEILFGDATFFIGENNVGKSSILKALEIFFSGKDKLEEQDYFFCPDSDYRSDTITLTAKFIELPVEANGWRGFKGRIFHEKVEKKDTRAIYYRKTYPFNGKAKREMKSYEKKIKSQFQDCININQFISNGAPLSEFDDVFTEHFDNDKKLTKKEKEKLELISELWDINKSKELWVQNPGGIDGNILIKIPRFLLVPAVDKTDEIEGTTGSLQKTMKELFAEVRDASDHYKNAQKYLNLLADELDPNDESKEFGRMMTEINDIVGDIFKESKIHVETNLSDPQTAIKPSFEIEMSSNIKTKPERQGMGAIRSAVFALLRYREKFIEKKLQRGDYVKTLIIGFEEPELYLHPNVAVLMREKIYELATSTNTKLVCTTHSPYMIDLSKKVDSKDFPSQVLNLVKIENKNSMNRESTCIYSFNTTTAYLSLMDDDKQFIKFILKIDDYVARVFFAKNIIIVEGDTEDIVFRETIKRLPEKVKKKVLTDVQIIKARGKAAIIPLIKYFKTMNINAFVIHDKDKVDGATKFNNAILKALDGNENRRIMLDYCIEDILGNEESSYGKPYSAFKHINKSWGEEWDGVQDNWRELIEERIFKSFFIEK
ncbi:MAG: ATP-dependent endonuclease [Candidatus Aminicenantes bacterium]|nr:ATP-dependent endonuclease [Candidatus Aminicenantes bacterium]